MTSSQSGENSEAQSDQLVLNGSDLMSNEGRTIVDSTMELVKKESG